MMDEHSSNDTLPVLGISAFIPARGGSERVKRKNLRHLGGYPLIAYSVAQAVVSNIFESVFVSTDSVEIAEVAKRYGAEVLELRSPDISSNVSPDIDWVEYLLDGLGRRERAPDAFCILRPTSPFRQPSTIASAWKLFSAQTGMDSLRAIEKCKQHPGKMWVVRNERMLPLLPYGGERNPWHSSQYQDLPEVYVQNASLEIAWSSVVVKSGTIAGSVILPWFTQGLDGFDINHEEDLVEANLILDSDPTVMAKDVIDYLKKCTS